MEKEKQGIRSLLMRLKESKVERDEAIIISAMVTKPGAAESLMRWMDKNPTATEDDILDQAKIIMDKTM